MSKRTIANKGVDRAVFDAIESLGDASLSLIAEEAGLPKEQAQSALRRLRREGVVEYGYDPGINPIYNGFYWHLTECALRALMSQAIAQPDYWLY